MTVRDPDRSQTLADPDMHPASAEEREDFSITTIDDVGGFEALRGEWDRLLSATEGGTVFQSWEWAFSWWQAFGRDKQLRVLAVRDGRSSLVALWPLYRCQARCLGFRLSALRLLGTGHGLGPDYMGCLVSPEGASAAVPALTDWLEENRREWDVLRLNEVRADAPWAGQLMSESAGRGWPACAVRRARCFYVELPDSWQAYCDLLPGHVRRSYRRRMRNLERFHPYYFRWENEEGLSGALARLGELHRGRWGEQADGHSAFSTPGYIRFHELLAPRAQKRGWLGLYCLSVNGEIISMLYTFEHDRIVYAYQSGIDPAWKDYSVGTALRSFALQDSIARGAREFDFLKGEHSYKLECTNRVRSTVNLLVNNSTLAGRVEYVHRVTAHFGKSAVRRALPGAVRQFARRARRNRHAGGVPQRNS
jgi:CelD/BcsL family acetyltransferase involved in cellulose biosynthesis